VDSFEELLFMSERRLVFGCIGPELFARSHRRTELLELVLVVSDALLGDPRVVDSGIDWHSGSKRWKD
jgi:hypothetical protein